MKLTQGILLVLEGIDGCGKSTQVAKLDEYLTQKDIPHVICRWGTQGDGLAIRNFMLNRQTPLHSCSYAYLYAAALDMVLREEILPALKEGKVVVCDRLMLSTFIYQGIVGGEYHLTNLLISGLREKYLSTYPNYTFVLDIPPEEARARMMKNRDSLDVMESVPLDVYTKRRNYYLNTAWYSKTIIDASGTSDAVASRIEDTLSPILDMYKQTS